MTIRVKDGYERSRRSSKATVGRGGLGSRLGAAAGGAPRPAPRELGEPPGEEIVGKQPARGADARRRLQRHGGAQERDARLVLGEARRARADRECAAGAL